jgi:hypothetical protein
MSVHLFETYSEEQKMDNIRIRKSYIIDKHISNGASQHTKAFRDRQHPEEIVPLDDNAASLIMAAVLENKTLANPDKYDVKVELIESKEERNKIKQKMTFRYNLSEDQKQLDEELNVFKNTFPVPTVQ